MDLRTSWSGSPVRFRSFWHACSVPVLESLPGLSPLRWHRRTVRFTVSDVDTGLTRVSWGHDLTETTGTFDLQRPKRRWEPFLNGERKEETQWFRTECLDSSTWTVRLDPVWTWDRRSPSPFRLERSLSPSETVGRSEDSTFQGVTSSTSQV